MFENLFGGGKKEQKQATGVVKPTMTIAPAPVAPAAPTAPAQTASGKDVATEVEDVKKEVDKLKDSMNALRGSLKTLTEKIEEIEKNLGQLASIYEMITNQMNPFLDEEEKKAVSQQAPAAPQPVQPVLVVQEREESPEVVLDRVDLTNPKVIQTIMDWMQFLVERVGHEGVQEILKYYVDIRWITEDVAQILLRYAEGIRVENEPVIEPPVQLDPEDHLKSLDYILQIKELMA